MNGRFEPLATTLSWRGGKPGNVILHGGFFLLLKQRFRSESLKRIYSRWSQSRFKRKRPQHDFIYRHNTAVPFELLIRCSPAFPVFAFAVPQNPARLHHTVAAVSCWITGLLQLFRPRSGSCHFQPKQVSLVLIYYLHPQFPLHSTPNWNNDITSLLRLSQRAMTGVLKEQIKSA